MAGIGPLGRLGNERADGRSRPRGSVMGGTLEG